MRYQRLPGWGLLQRARASRLLLDLDDFVQGVLATLRWDLVVLRDGLPLPTLDDSLCFPRFVGSPFLLSFARGVSTGVPILPKGHTSSCLHGRTTARRTGLRDSSNVGGAFACGRTRSKRAYYRRAGRHDIRSAMRVALQGVRLGDVTHVLGRYESWGGGASLVWHGRSARSVRGVRRTGRTIGSVLGSRAGQLAASRTSAVSTNCSNRTMSPPRTMK